MTCRVRRRIGRIPDNPVMREVVETGKDILDCATQNDRLESLSHAANRAVKMSFRHFFLCNMAALTGWKPVLFDVSTE